MSMTAALRQRARTTGRGMQAAAMQPITMKMTPTLTLTQMTHRPALPLTQRMLMTVGARLQMAEGRVALRRPLPLCAAYFGSTAQPRHMRCRFNFTG